MGWEFYLTISILTSVAATLYHRRLQHHGNHGELGYGVLSQFMAAFLIVIFVLFVGFDTRFELISWPNVAMAVVLWGAGDALLNLSLRVTDAALFSVLSTTAVFWGIVAAILFLDESLTVAALLGTLLIFGAVVTVVYERKIVWKSRPALLTLAKAFFFGLALTNDGIVLQDGYDVPSYYIFAFAAPALAITSVSSSARKSAKNLIKTGEYKSIWPLAALHAISGMTFFYAFQAGQDLAIIHSLNQTQIILVVLGGMLFLKERKDLAKRIVASFIAFIGVLLIVLN